MSIVFVEKLPPSEEILCELHRQQDLKFYLTGSRFFDTNKEFSDTDLFVANEVDIDAKLESLGFVREPSVGTYKDAITISVWRHRFANIHVQVCSDIEIKLMAQNILSNAKVFTYVTDKYHQGSIWQNLISYLINTKDNLVIVKEK